MLPLAVFLLLAIAPPDTAATIAYAPTVGELHLVRIEKVREEYAGRGDDRVLIDRVAHVWTAVASVERERLDGFELAWTYVQGEVDASGVPASPSIRFEPVTGTLSGVPIRFLVDARGQPRALIDPGTVRMALQRAIEERRPRTDPEDLPRLEQFARQARDDRGLRSILLPDLERYHLVLGRHLQLTEAVDERSDIRNPFGEGTIPATTTLQIDSLAADGRRAHISWSLTPDPEALARVVLDLLHGFAPGAVDLTPQELAARFGVRETATIVVDPVRGTVYQADFERRVDAGERLRREFATFRILETAPPD